MDALHGVFGEYMARTSILTEDASNAAVLFQQCDAITSNSIEGSGVDT